MALYNRRKIDMNKRQSDAAGLLLKDSGPYSFREPLRMALRTPNIFTHRGRERDQDAQAETGSGLYSNQHADCSHFLG
jgi:hypothetical protein